MGFAIRKARTGGPIARWGDQRGSVIVLALLIMMVIGLLGSTLLVMATTEDQIALNEVSAETAFFAADAAIGVAIRRIPDTTPLPANTNCQAVSPPTMPVAAGTLASFRTTCIPAGMPLAGNMTPYPVSMSVVPFTGTNMVYQNYQVDVVGAAGSAIRQLEVQDQYGPTSQDY